jgi:hypothetical protein
MWGLKGGGVVVFAKQSTYLIDFFHLTEYLLEASKLMNPANTKVWREKQQERMKKTLPALRVLRANEDWEQYWRQVELKVA